MKVNPFPWLPWWPKIDDDHALPIIVIGVVLAAILAYFLL